MSNLRDQLKKAKLLSEKDQRRLAHEERLHRTEVGREGIEAERSTREAELVGLREAERTRDIERQAALDAQRHSEAERAACLSILEQEARAPGRGGPWYFELEDGRLPFLRCDDADRQQLATGQVTIVRRGPERTHVYGLLATPLAQRVAKVFPERVIARAKS